MNGPLHPMIVHLPLAFALAAPVVLGVLVWLAWRGRGSRRAWLVVVALQAVILVSGFAALRTGEGDEERVEQVVAEAPIEAHEERAKLFVYAAAGLLALAIAGLALPKASKLLAPAGVAVALVVAGLGVSAGKTGGELVYRHGAAAAHVPAASGASMPLTSGDSNRESDGDE